MKTKLCYLFIMLALIAGVHQAAAQGTRFFRISGPAATKITAFQSDGTLVWTNALAGTNYTVQTRPVQKLIVPAETVPNPFGGRNSILKVASSPEAAISPTSGLFKVFGEAGGEGRYTMITYPGGGSPNELLWGPYVKLGISYAF